jgi:hypothetical protein
MEICLKQWEKFNQEETSDFTGEIRNILADKDSLLMVITQSHEYRSTKIYKLQEDIASKFKSKIETVISQTKQIDHERGRKRINDIHNLILNVNTEISLIVSQYD